jgi:hypothetical protein
MKTALGGSSRPSSLGGGLLKTSPRRLKESPSLGLFSKQDQEEGIEAGLGKARFSACLESVFTEIPAQPRKQKPIPHVRVCKRVYPYRRWGTMDEPNSASMQVEIGSPHREPS